MKERLLVMNGQCIVQREEGGEWVNHKVRKARGLKPGFYYLYLAEPADKTRRHDGLIVDVDGENVCQQVGNDFISHSRADFDQVSDIGSQMSISYNADGKATASADGVVKASCRPPR